MMFMTINFIFGLFVVATIVGNVAEVLKQMGAEAQYFRDKMEKLKRYLKQMGITKTLADHTMGWLVHVRDHKGFEADHIPEETPERIRNEMMIMANFDLVKNVPLFNSVEEVFLKAITVRLHLDVLSPGDFICQRGEIGREMYIIKNGSVNVLIVGDGQDNVRKGYEDSLDVAESHVVATLKNGAAIGELSILNIPGSKYGSLRTATVQCATYCDLLTLGKDDLWDVLKDYPSVRSILVERGTQILRKDGLIVEDRSEMAENMLEKSEEVNYIKKIRRMFAKVQSMRSIYEDFLVDFHDKTKELHERLNKKEKKD
ncbi:hypothetical protein ACOME3_002467 [Neoechinorhynchus agilis]